MSKPENKIWLNVYELKDEGSRVSIHYSREAADDVRCERVARIRVPLKAGRFDE